MSFTCHTLPEYVIQRVWLHFFSCCRNFCRSKKILIPNTKEIANATSIEFHPDGVLEEIYLKLEKDFETNDTYFLCFTGISIKKT